MKQLLASFFIIATIIGCKSDKKEKFDTKSYEQTKETLAEKEKNNPVKFLSVSSRDRKNLIGQTVVIGNITNNASVCWYKDIVVHISYFSKTGVKVDEILETVYENIAPGKSTKFKAKNLAPKGTDSTSVEITKAVGEIVAK